MSKNIEKYTLKNGEVRYRFQIALNRDPMTGKRRTTRRSGFKSRDKAMLEYTRLKAKVARGDDVEKVKSLKERKTFKEAYTEWLEIYKLKVKPITFKSVTSKAENHLIPVIGDKLIDRITPAYLQKYVNHLADHLGEFYHVISVLRRVFKYSVKMGYIKNNQLDRVEIPQENKRTLKIDSDLLTKEQLEQYLHYIKIECSFDTYVYFELLSRTGMRRGEALALKWSDLKGNKLHIRHTISSGYHDETIISETPKNSSSDRVIILDKKTLSLLNQWHMSLNSKLVMHEMKNDLDLVFVSFNNLKKRNGYTQPHSGAWGYDALKRLQQRHPNLKKIDAHGFRHTFATLALSSGSMSLLDLQHQLGHANYNTTLKYYAKYTTDQKEEASKKLHAFLDTIEK